jgi:hypothetical protein
MLLKDITDRYVDKEMKYNDAYNHLEDLREKLKEQEKQIDEKFEKLRSPSWVDEIIRPIAKELAPLIPHDSWNVLGPFGIGCTVAIHFYPEGFHDTKPESWKRVRSITFRPLKLERGLIGVVDYSVNTGDYPKDSIADVNGLNYPTIELDTEMDLKDLIQYVRGGDNAS